MHSPVLLSAKITHRKNIHVDKNMKIDSHYENTPMQYTGIFHSCRSDIYQLKMFDFFHIFAQNIDCGYTLEPPLRGGSNEYPQSMF